MRGLSSLQSERSVVQRSSNCSPKLVQTKLQGRKCRPVQRSFVAVAASRVHVASVEKTTETKSRPGEKKGFVEEMRFVAMKLHTKDQAPKEGGKEASKHPMQKWQPTKQGYLNFLAESKILYDTIESIVAESSHPEVSRFQNTKLERAGRLAEDLEFFKSEYGLEPSTSGNDGPGEAYSGLLKDLASTDIPAFLCHFYNIYFAHTAGGRMIGTKVASMILDNKKLEFYNYDGDHKPYLEDVRDRLNSVAEGWSREQKDHCLGETEKSFKYSGGLLQLVAT